MGLIFDGDVTGVGRKLGKYFLTHNEHESLCVIRCENCMILIKLGPV